MIAEVHDVTKASKDRVVKRLLLQRGAEETHDFHIILRGLSPQANYTDRAAAAV